MQIYTLDFINPNLYQYVINHETGHVFGIGHNPEGLSYCPGDSIMHYLSPCLSPPTNASTYPWPTSEDKASVVDIMGPFPDSGSGSGSGRAMPL
ncbi:MAG: hypothetical protein Q7T33_14005 [Dehalococcoidia bacterium]|nr:hypothetical protein [Dehalococcoidia bacterium]